tara:strand:+ start:550 stop:1911 length:1362 start_codon:yes stop_codon:yes gene_type:complete
MCYRKIQIIYCIIALSIIACDRKEITFHQDVKSIIHQNCASCHNDQGAAPFSLISYTDISKRSQMIAKVTSEKYMPPWPANTEYSSFLNEKKITEKEVKTIIHWIEGGKKEGILTNNHLLDSILKEEVIKKPDLKINMKQAHITNGLNQDEFLMMKFPFELEQDTFIRKIEFIPHKKQIVHHINAHLISYNDIEKDNIFKGDYTVDTESFSDIESFQKLDLLNDDETYPLLTRSVSNYLPGSEQTEYPSGIGGFIAKKKNIILVNDFHYGPTPYQEKDSSYFNIYFTPDPPKRIIQETQLGTFGISKIIPPLVIPPNEIKSFTTRAIITKDISILTINPHMHLLGKSFLAYAVTIQQDTIPLIKIDNWNFRWQYFYTFKKMLKIPAGSEIIVEAIYDNTENNPDNPFSPPKEISEREDFNGRGSMKTSNEMLQFIINYLPYETGDENIYLGVE